MLESKEDKTEDIPKKNSKEETSNIDNDTEDTSLDQKEVAVPKITQELGENKNEEIVTEITTSENVQELKGGKNEAEEEKGKEIKKEESSKQTLTVNYDAFSLEELVDALEKLLLTQKVNQIKSTVEIIKTTFNINFGKLLAEKKASFLADGGNSIDFQFSSPVKSRYNKLLSDYKKERDLYYSNLDKQLKENLEKRNQVIEDLKSLIEEADTKTMYKSFRDLQNVWRTIGPVPKTKYNDTWKIYHHHVERFYDLLHLSNDFRDLDFKNNLEEKLTLIEKAEVLAEEKDINYAFKELQKLHKIWKEDIGPVAKEMREDIWQKFSAATKKIHDKRHDHFRDMKSQYGKIIEDKLQIIEEILAYDSSKNTTHKHWQKSIKDIEALREKYFDAGKLPYSKSESVWQKFKEATKKFNQEKNKFYKQEKSSQQSNLQAKLALIKLAEDLKNSEDWENTTNTFKKIQSDWKKIGHVPRKFSDDIWKKFKAACNHYFDRYHNQKNTLSDEQIEILEKKSAFLEKISIQDYTTKESISELMSQWNLLGVLPKSSKNIDVKFNKFIDNILSNLTLDKDELILLKFKNIVNHYLANNNIRKLESELIFIKKKIDENEREIQQLENNLSFFSNASEDNPMVKNVRNSIKNFKEGLIIWKKKLHYLKTLEY